MSEYSELQRNYTTHAFQALPPILDAAADALGLEDREQVELLGKALAEAYIAGADAGQAEVMAQAVEQGVRINVTKVPPPD